jgi:hypothetical protein
VPATLAVTNAAHAASRTRAWMAFIGCLLNFRFWIVCVESVGHFVKHGRGYCILVYT